MIDTNLSIEQRRFGDWSNLTIKQSGLVIDPDITTKKIRFGDCPHALQPSKEGLVIDHKLTTNHRRVDNRPNLKHRRFGD